MMNYGHDGKTKILKIGGLRRKQVTKNEFGVKFTILEDNQNEQYLGDIISNHVTEEITFREKIKIMKEIGERWNREKVTIYGKALVSNTLMSPVVQYRARVNHMGKQMRKEILEEIKQFVWKGELPLKWKIAIRSVEEGGIGVKDTMCMIDSTKITMIRYEREE
jgi:hypothetical protein